MSMGERNNGFDLEDERDRLPWLEPAGIEEEAEPVSPIRIVGLIALGLLLLGVIVGGGYWLKNRDQGGDSGGGDARLIAAESEAYKVPANASDARSFDGEGDEAYEASEGREATGRIDASRVAEAPRTDLQQAPAPVEPAARPATTRPTVSAPVRAAAPAVKTPAPAQAEALSDGPRIQLGAFGSRALAAEVWKKHSARFDYLTPLKHSVEPVETGGRTLFRLRAGVGSVAEGNEICGRLRVAGENCMVVR